MSCVVGIRHQGKVYIGVDSCTSNDFVYELSAASRKVFYCGPVLVGACGSPRSQQIIQYVFKPDDYDFRMDALEYLVTKFALPLRLILQEHGAVKESEKEDSGDTTQIWCILGLAGRLFRLYGNFMVIEFADDYTAEGSGMPLALGSLYSTQGKAPEERIRIALEAAAKFDDGVRAPFIIESMPVQMNFE